MKTIALDANVVLRYLLADHPVFSQKAKKLFKIAEEGKLKLFLDEVVLAEIVWTLSSFHKIPRGKINEQLGILVSQNWLFCRRKKLMLEALNNFAKKNVDYIDAWLFSVAKKLNFQIGSFDKDFNRLDKKIVISLE